MSEKQIKGCPDNRSCRNEELIESLRAQLTASEQLAADRLAELKYSWQVQETNKELRRLLEQEKAENGRLRDALDAIIACEKLPLAERDDVYVLAVAEAALSQPAPNREATCSCVPIPFTGGCHSPMMDSSLCEKHSPAPAEAVRESY